MANPYQAPEADEAPPYSDPNPGHPPFYAVGIAKLWVMTLATSGLYLVFWFERQWRHFQTHSRQPMMPFWRGVFSVLFVYKLFHVIAAYGHRVRVELLMNPRSSANMFVGLTIGSVLLRHVAEVTGAPRFGVLISFLMLTASVSPIALAQREINRILEQEHPGFEKNTRLTPWNILVLATVGAFFAFSTAAQLGLYRP